MNAPAALVVASPPATLPDLIDRAVKALAGARTAAEVLEARDLASVAYDIAKKTARLGRAKQAHDDLIAAAQRAQGHALQIEAEAKHRLADEYDAAQERGEVAAASVRTDIVPLQNDVQRRPPTAAEVGLSRKDMHEARIIRDAENAEPGIVQRTVEAALSVGEEPTKAKVRRAVLHVVRATQPEPSSPTRGREAICARVRDAITALSGLPPAAEVAGYFRGTDAAIVVSDHLSAVAEWMMDFAIAWGEKHNADD